MAERLRYHPLAAEDIAAAIHWYEGRSVASGWFLDRRLVILIVAAEC